jgi:hypothetical protein
MANGQAGYLPPLLERRWFSGHISRMALLEHSSIRRIAVLVKTYVAATRHDVQRGNQQSFPVPARSVIDPISLQGANSCRVLVRCSPQSR